VWLVERLLKTLDRPEDRRVAVRLDQLGNGHVRDVDQLCPGLLVANNRSRDGNHL
jgi:hypothetical protein